MPPVIVDKMGGNISRIALKRQAKENVYFGEFQGINRVVIVPRNNKSIPQGILSSIWRQAGITNKSADELWQSK